MPAQNTTSYAANATVRWLLTDLGRIFDKDVCKKPPIRGNSAKKHRAAVLKHFDHRCCYCQEKFHAKNRKAEREHLIPMNADYGGLHSWKNVVLCCRNCNNDRRKKHKLSLAKYLSKRKKALVLIQAWRGQFPSDKTHVASAQKLATGLYKATKDLLKEYVEKIEK